MRTPAPILFPALGVAVVVACLAGAGAGAYPVPPADIVASIGEKLGLGSAGLDPTAESVLWEIRFPRVALALVVGAALATAGAVMQGTLANPLAEPGVVGVSSGAAVGAVAAIVFGITALGTASLTAAAFAGGLVTVAGVYAAARSNGRTEVVTLVLTGIAVNALAGALIGLMTFFSTDEQLRSITFWTLGSVAHANWTQVALVAPLAVLGVAVATVLAPRLDLLSLGEGPARHLGVNLEHLRVVMLLLVALLSAAAVAVAGILLFVGLVVPHVIRMIAGPSHRVLMLGSALAGAALLVSADLVARTIAAPAEIPLGVLTSLVGSPFFFWLLRRTRARQGGWA